MATTTVLSLAAGAAGLALLFALLLIRYVLRQPEGAERMREIARSIQEGASVFLRKELTAIAVFSGIMATALILLVEPGRVLLEEGFAFALGTGASFSAGYLGMWIATRANVRTAHVVSASFARGMRTAFFGGAVMGTVSVALGLLGLTAVFALFPEEQNVWLAYAFGASSVALFLRVGGGIFTKSADVGADLVGKVEAGIPEDDPRNPAVIADNVGDNVGDVAGMGSDLYESYVSALAAAMVLGLILDPAGNFVLLPLLLGAVGLVASLAGILAVRPREAAEGYEAEARSARRALNLGVYVSTALTVVLGYLAFSGLLGAQWLGPFVAMVAGLLGGFLIGLFTQYYTSENRPVRGIAEASESGAAINLLEGLSVGMVSTVPPVLVVAGATLVAFMASEATLPGSGLYGVAIAAVGMLVTLAMLLSTDAYGPIADNAAGIAEMTGLGGEARERAEALDAVGNTTAAIGKGFAIASAALASLAWIATFFVVADLQEVGIREVPVVAGLLIGSMLAFLFSALTLRAVSAGAFLVVGEVRRQFAEVPGLREGEATPDYEVAISLVTGKALRAMFLPGLLVILVPLAVGLTLGAEALAGLLSGALLTGFLLAIAMANSGGAWDNAKKLIESGVHGGKGSEAHKAAVIGDTVGDPFKDTAGPSLNILIKLVGKVAVLFAPLFTYAVLVL